jgi:L-lactate dehydrogenase complex protein LldF
VKIDIPSVLIHMRGRVVRDASSPAAERWAMGVLARLLSSRRRYEAAQRAIRLGRVPLRLRAIAGALPGPLRAWTRARELPSIPDQTFREWWRSR